MPDNDLCNVENLAWMKLDADAGHENPTIALNKLYVNFVYETRRVFGPLEHSVEILFDTIHWSFCSKKNEIRTVYAEQA